MSMHGHVLFPEACPKVPVSGQGRDCKVNGQPASRNFSSHGTMVNKKLLSRGGEQALTHVNP